MAFINLIILSNHEVILDIFWPLVYFRGIIITERQGFSELWSAKLDLQIKAVKQLVNVGCFGKGCEILQDMSKLFCVPHSSKSLSYLADFISVHKLQKIP